MLDTDLLLLKGLVPPKIVPPPWMPMRINWRHPVARGLHFFQLLNTPHVRTPMLCLSGETPLTTSGDIKPSKVGLGFNGASTYLGSSSNNYDVPTAAGSLLLHVSSATAGNDGAARYLSHIGKAWSPGTVATLELTKFSDNNWYFGWTAASNTRVSVSATGTFAAGDSFTVGGRWKSSTELFCKGLQIATNASAPSTGSTTGASTYFYIGNGNIGGGSNSYWCRAAGDYIHYKAIWSRDLTDREFLLLELDPYCFLEPDLSLLLNGASVASYTLTAEAGSFTLTGNATGLTAARLLTGGTGAFTETGNATGLAAARLLTAEAQSYALTGNATGLAYGRTMVADVGDFTLTGVDAALSRSRVLQADTGEFVLTGNATSLTYSGAATAAGGSVGKARRRRKARDEVEGNRDFTPKRNSRPGVAEEEMREVLAEVRAKMPVTVPLDAIEDDDEEAILWLI